MKSASKVNAPVPIEQVRATIMALKKARGAMGLMTLTPEERKAHAPNRLKRDLPVLESRLGAARQHRELLPSSFDLPQFESEIELTLVLRDCLTLVNELQQALGDTLLVVGSGALAASGLVVGHLKLAVTPGEGLDRPKRGRRSSRPGSTTSPPPAAVDAPAPAPVSGSENVDEVPVVPTRNAA